MCDSNHGRGVRGERGLAQTNARAFPRFLPPNVKFSCSHRPGLHRLRCGRLGAGEMKMRPTRRSAFNTSKSFGPQSMAPRLFLLHV